MQGLEFRVLIVWGGEFMVGGLGYSGPVHQGEGWHVTHQFEVILLLSMCEPSKHPGAVLRALKPWAPLGNACVRAIYIGTRRGVTDGAHRQGARYLPRLFHADELVVSTKTPVKLALGDL